MYTGGRATSWRHFPSLSRWNAMHSFISWSCKRDSVICGRIYFPPFYHQENTGPLYWKRWVKVSLKFRNAAVVPTWPLDLLGKKLINLASFYREFNFNRLPFHDDWRHLDQLNRRLAIFQSLAQIEQLTSHDTHLAFKHMSIEAFVFL